MLGLGLGLALGLGLGLRLGFEPSSPIVRELVLNLTRLSFPLVRFRHNSDTDDYSLVTSLMHNKAAHKCARALP